jgi:peptidoglycan/xylan/chitin deacetylase (PgdA/CDA1 family)
MLDARAATTRSCQVAFSFDFDAEEVWLAEDPENADRPGVLSQGIYGAKVGLPLVLDVLRRSAVRATFFIPGRVAERYPERVGEILRDGHEIGHHGYTHRSPSRLAAAEEEAELVKGKAILESCGATVEGYRSPSWEFSPRTLDLLDRHGFRYSSNLMDDIRPYRHDGSRVVEVPVQWILDDAPHFWFSDSSWDKKIATVDEVRSIWLAELQGICALGGACVFTMHPQIIGRPGRLPLLESMIAAARRVPHVALMTVGEIAATVSGGPA